MTFDEILTQTLALLQRDWCVSYQALAIIPRKRCGGGRALTCDDILEQTHAGLSAAESAALAQSQNRSLGAVYDHRVCVSVCCRPSTIRQVTWPGTRYRHPGSRGSYTASPRGALHTSGCAAWGSGDGAC